MFSLSKRGLGTGMVSVFIGLMIATIIGVSVTLPIISDTVTNLTTVPANGTAAVSGTTATIILLLPLFIGIILLVMYANTIQ